MPRLVAFGCSFTYGHGLPDCADGNDAGPNPSKVAWPSLLAKKLGRSVVNMGEPGAGNTEILWKIFNFDFEPDDICVVMWSYFTRSEFYMYTETGGIRIREDRQNPRFYQNEDLFLNHNIIANLLTIDHAARYLDDLKIKSYAYIGPRRTSDKDYARDGTFYFKPHNKIKISNLDLTFSLNHCMVDQGMDGMHPGVKSHRIFAQQLYGRINV